MKELDKYPDIMKPSEVLEVCRISRPTLRKWIANGYLTAMRIPPGGKARFLKAEVEALLRAGGMRGE